MADPGNLADVPLFASLSEEERRELAPGFAVQTAEAGSRLIGEGARGYSFFVLLEGTVAVTSSTLAEELVPGDFFGEIALLIGGRRTASVTATSHVKLLVMSAAGFRRLQDSHPAIAAKIKEAQRERYT